MDNERLNSIKNKFSVKVSSSKDKNQIDERIKSLITNGCNIAVYGPNVEEKLKELLPDSVVISDKTPVNELIGERVPLGGTPFQRFWAKPNWLLKINDVCKREPDKNHVLLVGCKPDCFAFYYDTIYPILFKHKFVDLNQNNYSSNVGFNPYKNYYYNYYNLENAKHIDYIDLPQNCVVVFAETCSENDKPKYLIDFLKHKTTPVQLFISENGEAKEIIKNKVSSKFGQLGEVDLEDDIEIE